MAGKQHDRLVEEYEDALFALLMEEVVQNEGVRLEALNEELRKRPEAAVPEDVDKRCLSTINRHFLKERRRSALRRMERILCLAAIVIGISTLLFTSAFAVSEKVRLTTLNLILNFTETHASFKIEGEKEAFPPENSSTGNGRYFQDAEIGWIPDGFQYSEKNSQYDEYAMFKNNQGVFFIISIIPGTGNVNIDTEGADSVEQLFINGNEGLCVVKNREFEIMVVDLTNCLYYEVGGSIDLTVDTAKIIAESIYII